MDQNEESLRHDVDELLGMVAALMQVVAAQNLHLKSDPQYSALIESSIAGMKNRALFHNLSDRSVSACEETLALLEAQKPSPPAS